MPPSIPSEVNLTIFGGMDTSMDPTSLPEGLSPACNDMEFEPQGVNTRRCLNKIFAAPFAGVETKALWAKKYLQANGLPLNLYLDSQGVLRYEDPVNNPGVSNVIQQLSPAATTFKSVSFDGVEYMAFSDGKHPVDIPRFYDTYLGVFDRISKDGVGDVSGLMTVVDVTTQVNVTSITLADLGGGILTITESGNLVTVTTNAAHGLKEPGGFVLIYGVTTAGYNGLFQIESIPTATSFTVVNAGTGLAADNTGHVGLGTVTVVTAAPHGLNVGDAAVLATTGSSFNNGTNQTSNTPVPSFWDVVQVTNATTFLFSLVGLRGQGSLNTTSINGGGAAGTVQTGGMITLGTHQVCVSFLWRGGYITKPCPPISWTCTGNKQALIQNIPTGPPGVIARILHFTGAGGGNFFSIPKNVKLPGNSLLFNGALAPSTVVNSTWILDNVTTSLTVDFPDNTLFNGLAADITGNDLFALNVLGPCLGIDAYASRLMAYGAVNKVENFLNMGFDGGTRPAPNATAPLTWTIPSGGGAGAVVNGGAWAGGAAYQITGDGVAHTQGLISQSAYQNYLFQPIVEPNIQYSLMIWAKASAPNLNGLLEVQIQSLSTGFLATAFININQLSTVGAFTPLLNFDHAMPAVIPSDMTISLFAFNLNNGATVLVDDGMIVFTNQPYKDRVFDCSYVNNPESFDGETGELGSSEDPCPIKDTFQLLESFWFLTGTSEGSLHVTRDAGVEPGAPDGGWTVTRKERNVGAPSIHSATTGTGWAAWLVDGGQFLAARAFSGADSGKISREMKTTFQGANMAAKHTAWIQNVDEESKVYVGLPQGNATLPSILSVLDYFYSDTAGEIIANRPLKIGLMGKMLTTDLGRKWNNWNLALNCGTILARANGIEQFCVLGNFGNAYTFSATKFTDDDYGAMLPVYTTYFFPSHEKELELQLGGKLKLFGGGEGKKLTIFITGIGHLVITPLVNIVGNKWMPVDSLQAIALSLSQADDLELDIEVRARRCALQIAVVPDPSVSATDVQFSLSHLAMPISRHPVGAVGGQNAGYAI